jgi:hypothetical protein
MRTEQIRASCSLLGMEDHDGGGGGRERRSTSTAIVRVGRTPSSKQESVLTDRGECYRISGWSCEEDLNFVQEWQVVESTLFGCLVLMEDPVSDEDLAGTGGRYIVRGNSKLVMDNSNSACTPHQSRCRETQITTVKIRYRERPPTSVSVPGLGRKEGCCLEITGQGHRTLDWPSDNLQLAGVAGYQKSGDEDSKLWAKAHA